MLFILIPIILSFILMLCANVSMTKMNRYGDKGQPCLRPRPSFIGSVTQPLFNTFEFVFLYKVLIQFIMFSPKLKNRRLFFKNDHSIESNAFSKSIFTIIPSVSFFSQYSITFIALFIFSPINMRYTKKKI